MFRHPDDKYYYVTPSQVKKLIAALTWALDWMAGKFEAPHDLIEEYRKLIKDIEG